MEWIALGVALAIALTAAAAAYLANKHSPDRSIRLLLDRTITRIGIGLLVLTLVSCGVVLRTGCTPSDSVCDGPSMAALGVLSLGAVGALALLFIGIPVAFGTLKLLRRK